jgi:uncharacterized protein YdeI (BOF family)
MDILPQVPAEVVEFADSSGELVVSVNRDRFRKKSIKYYSIKLRTSISLPSSLNHNFDLATAYNEKTCTLWLG